MQVRSSVALCSPDDDLGIGISGNVGPNRHAALTSHLLLFFKRDRCLQEKAPFASFYTRAMQVSAPCVQRVDLLPNLCERLREAQGIGKCASALQNSFGFFVGAKRR